MSISEVFQVPVSPDQNLYKKARNAKGVYRERLIDKMAHYLEIGLHYSSAEDKSITLLIDKGILEPTPYYLQRLKDAQQAIIRVIDCHYQN